MADEITYACPHCTGTIIVDKLNCGIFRHGVFKNSGKQMDPHMKKEECDRLSSQNLIHGCGKPFQIIQKNKKFEIQTCDYI